MSSKEFKQFLRQNKLLLPQQPIHDDFLDVIEKVFHWSCFYGVFGSKRFISLIWSTLILGSLVIIEVLAIWKVIRALAGVARDMSGHRSVTARLAGTIFYSISILSLVLISKLYYNWRTNIAGIWGKVERSVGVKIPVDKTLKCRMSFVAGLMTFCSFFEHALSILASVGFDCPPSLILKRYVLVSHGFIFMGQDYSEWFAMPLVIISTIATLLWNFQDQLIVLISMGLTSRYRRLNECLAKFCELEKQHMDSDKKVEAVKVYTWRKIREAYVKQAMLVRKIDVALGGIIILSCSCNFYFICLQMFLGITQGMSTDFLTGLYYMVSLAWLCIRVLSVVLAASGVNTHSKLALNHLYTYETHCYNVEVERLQDQLTKDYIALSGMGFFYLNKTILLQMAGAIITYELVLIQFDDQGNDGIALNATNI
ncbi:gustatory receptor for sugar taste 64a [Helicoverpa armigera]|uniref:gustatory receptor for sugar taste 64a n=1 Tax=Helicoverpa armigera TaxID=29058 RepID=UPI003083BE87